MKIDIVNKSALYFIGFLDNDLNRDGVCHQFGIFDVQDAPHTGRPVIENVDKITEIIEVDRLVSSCSIAQRLKIDHKTVLSHLRKVEFKNKLHVWVPQQLTP
ncbi:histone-lysine N-methyltransferase SETMAR [Trichonephila clavipes]|nr:histone-lysine N-methyltransferase SETMAR [Trichonephila clavipes]